MKLSQNQKEILALFQQGLRVTDISKRRGVSKSAISKTLKKLILKGYVKNTRTRGLPNTHHTTPPPKKTPYKVFGSGKKKQSKKIQIRYHGIMVRIKPYYIGDRYYRKLAKSKRFSLMGFTIRLFKKSLEIYSQTQTYWKADNVEDCTRAAEESITILFKKLENDLGIGIVKDRKQNIFYVKGHYAEENSETGKIIPKLTKKSKYEVRGKDGKIWLLIDKSWKVEETECVHPSESKVDAELMFDKYFNDIRENSPPLPSEQYKLMSMLMAEVKAHLLVVNEIKEYSRKASKNLDVNNKILEKILKGGKDEKGKEEILDKEKSK